MRSYWQSALLDSNGVPATETFTERVESNVLAHNRTWLRAVRLRDTTQQTQGYWRRKGKYLPG